MKNWQLVHNDPSKARIRVPMVRIDNVTAEYLAEEAKTTPETLISKSGKSANLTAMKK